MNFPHTPDMNGIRLGTNLKHLLRNRGLSLKEVSIQTGIPYSTLHTWLENRQPKDILKAKRLADFFGVDLHFLLFGEEERPPSPTGPDLPGAGDLVGVFEVTVRRRRS